MQDYKIAGCEISSSPVKTDSSQCSEDNIADSMLGLSSAEAARLVSEGKVNRTKIKSGKSYAKIIADNLFTYFNLIYAIVTLALSVFGSFSNLTFLAVIIPNLLIAIIQEIRAKRTVEKLSVTTDPKATVVRDGVSSEIDACDIVLGDLMHVEAGRQVLSDSIVTSGVCEANESLLTGESNAVRKEAGDRLLAGSFIVAGAAYARVDRVGEDNYVTTLEKSAKAFKAPSSNLFRDLNKLIKGIGIFMIPLAIALFISNFFYYGGDFSDFNSIKTVVEKTCGSVIGMIPAGMYLLITLTLSLSVITLGRKKTLVQDMYSIEMLASADVLCLDKTGTITDGTMEVSEVLPLGAYPCEKIEEILAYISGSTQQMNATSRAIAEKFGVRECTVTDRIPFSSSRKYSAADMEGVGCFSLGAPHFVPCEISPETERLIESYASRGGRVLVLAEMADIHATDAAAVALVVINDRIRPSAEETIAKFQSQDVRVKVISGDHAATVSSIAKRVGIIDAERYISCESLSDEELVAAAEEYAVFGRVTPEQKVLLVKTLKKNGHTVAMTGDGVNDTLALKEANCAIAMADGSEVARKVSQIVLMNSDFSTLPDVVREGRRCINNVRQSSSLYLMKTVFTILITIFSIVTVSGYPFGPSAFAFLELFIIGLASVCLALEPNEKRIEGSFISKVLVKSMPLALAMFIPTLAVLLVGRFVPGIDDGCRNSVAMCVVTLVGYLNLTHICRPYTKWRLAVAVGIGIILAIFVPLCGTLDVLFFESSFFGFPNALRDPAFLGITLGVGVAVGVCCQLISHATEKLCQRTKKGKDGKKTLP